jgi:hypothetical protein
MNRQEANRIILSQISAMIEGAPDLRFHQILINMGINKTKMMGEPPNEFLMCEDLFHEESTKTLERLTKENA